ncbi:MAG: RluA family pseudouridine synthase [Clostridia bacterium]|nr:RluA family pseudouridine synthase [Clostridia bacterium]
MIDTVTYQAENLYEDGDDFETAEAVVPEGAASRRFDTLLCELFPELIVSRSRAQKLIEDGNALAGGKRVKAGTGIKPGSVITVIVPAEAEEWTAEPENIPIDVIYEDSDLIVVNKPRGMVVHPAAGNRSGTLVNALLYHCSDLSGVGGVLRPGIVHRIDKDTTGLLAVAKNDRAHLALSAQLKDRTMHRIYLAVAEGIVRPEEGTIDAPIGRSPKDRKKMAVVASGRRAVTRYKVLCADSSSRLSLLGLSLDTGRTHQIRVHLKHIGHPVSGDPVYGIKNMRGMAGQALHAVTLILTHPGTGEKMRFDCPPPDDMEELIVRAGLRAGEELFNKCDW